MMCTVCVVAGAEGGATEGGLLPLPKPPKRLKGDVSKLRVGGGEVWQDHSLEDWDQSEIANLQHVSRTKYFSLQTIIEFTLACIHLLVHVVCWLMSFCR